MDRNVRKLFSKNAKKTVKMASKLNYIKKLVCLIKKRKISIRYSTFVCDKISTSERNTFIKKDSKSKSATSKHQNSKTGYTKRCQQS